MSVTKFYKMVQPDHESVKLTNNSNTGAIGMYGNYTWYSRMVQGSATRLVKYKEYDIMDNDIDIARSLDIIAEEMTGNNPKNKQPLLVNLDDNIEQKIPSRTAVTLRAALKTWSKIQQWDKRMFELARNTVKYGDCFFLRAKEKNKKMRYVHPKHVISAAVSDNDITDIKGWYIKSDFLRADQSSESFALGGSGNNQDTGVEYYPADEVIRYSLSDEMSPEAPFGISILRPVYSTFKQKELLEDAILIYRIQRAPERRVFYIDTGRMPPNKVKAHLEGIKNELKQKKVPTSYGGTSQVDSVYNPQSTQEDFIFSVGEGGRGSRVETLPGGQGLGELTDLEYFYKKMWRAMRIPNSYLSNTMEDGAVDNNGRVGIAYMQEIKFTLYIERLQSHIERVMDEEFKAYLYALGVYVDPTLYNIVLPAPSDYSTSRDQLQNAENLTVYSQAQGVDALSSRFALSLYLKLTPDQIKLNERMKAEELGLDPNDDKANLTRIYSPDDAELGGHEGGMSSGGGLSGGGAIGGGLSPKGDDPKLGDADNIGDDATGGSPSETDNDKNVGDTGGSKVETGMGTPSQSTPKL